METLGKRQILTANKKKKKMAVKQLDENAKNKKPFKDNRPD